MMMTMQHHLADRLTVETGQPFDTSSFQDMKQAKKMVKTARKGCKGVMISHIMYNLLQNRLN